MTGLTNRNFVADLPEDWTEKRADFLCSTARKTVEPKLMETETVWHYSIPNVQEFGEAQLELAASIDSSKMLIEQETLLVSKLNPRKKTICIATPGEDSPTVASSEFVAVQSDEIDRRFAFYVWSSEKVTDRLSAIVQSVTRSHQRVNPADITKLPWRWPDLDTQQRIAGYLDEKTAQIDALIEKKQALLDRLAEKRQALITRAVTRGLDPDVPLKDSGSEWLGQIPAHWTVRPLKWRVRVQSGQVDPVADDYKDLPLIAPDHIEQRTGRIIEVLTADEQSAMSGKYLCAPTAVLYSKIRPALRKAAVFAQECLCSADMYPLNPGEEVERDFLLFFLLTEAFSAYAELSSLRVAMPKVNREALGAVEICIPPLEEQRTIAQLCNTENEKHLIAIDKVGKSVDRLTEYRAALVTAAVTGKIKALLSPEGS